VTTTLAAAFVLGVAGSAHCAGMCGPLVLLARRGRLLHQTGRLATYITLGVLAGVSGGVAGGTGYAQAFSISMGLALLLGALGIRATMAPGAREPRASRLVTVMQRVAVWRRRHDAAGALLFGALNGLLPCGLVYAALVGAAGLGHPASAAAFMAAFWAGSLPALVAVTWSADVVRRIGPSRLRRAMPVAMALVGVLLIARGLWPPHDHGLAVPHAAHLGPR
jgi:sulfite exporter TauE/SafE